MGPEVRVLSAAPKSQIYLDKTARCGLPLGFAIAALLHVKPAVRGGCYRAKLTRSGVRCRVPLQVDNGPSQSASRSRKSLELVFPRFRGRLGT